MHKDSISNFHAFIFAVIDLRDLFIRSIFDLVVVSNVIAT
jgi:hypothetical protein